MKMAKIQTPIKILMLWLRSFDILFWLLVKIVPITNTTTEYRRQQYYVPVPPWILCSSEGLKSAFSDDDDNGWRDGSEKKTVSLDPRPT